MILLSICLGVLLICTLIFLAFTNHKLPIIVQPEERISTSTIKLLTEAQTTYLK